jgi:Transposase
MARIYPAEFRRDAVALVRSSDKTVTQVARELGLNRETLRLWVIPEGAGTVNPYDEDRPWCCVPFPPTGGQPSARRRGLRWSARSAARTYVLEDVKG